MADNDNDNVVDNAKGDGMVRKRVGAWLDRNERIEGGERELNAERLGCCQVDCSFQQHKIRPLLKRNPDRHGEETT